MLTNILYGLMLLTCAYAAIDLNTDTLVFTHPVRPFLQANRTFPNLKRYLESHLPQHSESPDTSKYIPFGILVGVVGGLAQAYIIDPKNYDPQKVLEEYASYSKSHYSEIAATSHKLLKGASQKIIPVVELVNNLCTRNTYIDCNHKVEANVWKDPHTYRLPAKLLSHLGKVAKTISRNIVLIEKLSRDADEAMSYLTQHVGDSAFSNLIKKLARTYVIMKRMGPF